MRFATVSLLAPVLLAAPATAAPPYAAELVFPLHPQHNHAPGIVECPNGDLLVSWYRGSGERSADDVAVYGARRRKGSDAWSEPFVLADTPGFPETNPVLFIDARRRLMFFWPLIIAHQWETALMKYRISTDYQQASGPPKWEFQDNIVLIPKNIAAKTKEWIARENPAPGGLISAGAHCTPAGVQPTAEKRDCGNAPAMAEPMTGGSAPRVSN